MRSGSVRRRLEAACFGNKEERNGGIVNRWRRRAEWGWRLPFLFSIVLLGISVWMRLKLDESPAFRRMKAAGRTSKAPLSEAFGRWGNLKLVLVAFVGLAKGQAVTWYTGQFYSLFFLTQTLKVDGATAALLVAVATVLSVPFYFVTARLSDRIGRKPVFMAGLLSGILLFFPLYQALTHYVNPAIEVAQRNALITVTADPADCSLQFNPVGTVRFLSSCDVARASLSKADLSYSTATAAPGSVARIGMRIPDHRCVRRQHGRCFPAEAFNSELRDALRDAGYSAKADPVAIDKPMAILVLLALMVCGTITYGPLAAMLVEMFPTRIRYTSLSLPYHVGIGWFGGFLPAAAFAIVAATGNIYSGLWYPVVIASIALVVCLLFLKETRGVDIHAGE